MKFVITGGAGFIGSRLAETLIRQDHTVAVIDTAADPKPNSHPRVEYHVKDILDESVKGVFSGADGVFHLAAFSKTSSCIEQPETAEDINIGGTLNILRAVTKRLVFASSASVYFKNRKLPFREDDRIDGFITPYAFTKYVGEILCRQFSSLNGIETVSLRLFNVYGSVKAVEGVSPCPSVVEIFLNQKREGKPLSIVGDGSQRRDLVYVDDVVRALVATMLSPRAWRGEVINIGSGRNYSVEYLAFLVGSNIVRIKERYLEPQETLADITRAEEWLGWQPKMHLEDWVSNMIISSLV